MILWAGFQFEIIPYLFDLQEASPEWTPSLCRPPPDGRPPVLACCGHRGAPKLAPENTLPAFRKAFKVYAVYLKRTAGLVLAAGTLSLLWINYQLPRRETCGDRLCDVYGLW